MTVTFPYKDPDEDIDYTIDWSADLGEDTIDSSVWTVPLGITDVADSNTTTSTTIRLSGGSLGEIYTLNNHIVTAGGQEFDQTATIRIRGK